MATNDPRQPDDSTPADKTPTGAAPSHAGATPTHPGTGPSASYPGTGATPTHAGTEDVVDIGQLPPGGDSAIPLASLPEPPSGQSLTTWTEVIRRQRAARAAARGKEPVQVDAASDKDLLNRLAEAEQRGEAPSGVTGLKRPGDTSEIPEGALPIFPAPPKSESEIDLGPMPSTGPATGGSEVRFDILYPPSDAGGAMPLPSADVPPVSSVEFFPSVALPAPPDDDDEAAVPFAAAVDPGLSGVDLGGPGSGILGEPGRSSILDVLLREPDAGSSASVLNPKSDILDFGDVPPVRPIRPTAPAVGPDPTRSKQPTQPGIDLSAETDALADSGPIDLTGPASGYRSSDDSIDLLAGPGAPPSLTDSGTLEISDEVIEESQRRAEQLESSAVDLNPQPSYSGMEFDAALDSEKGAGAQASDNHVSMDLPPLEDLAGSSVIQPRVLAQEKDALAAELQSRRAKPPAAKPPAPPRATREIVPVRQLPSADEGRRGYLLHGGIIGLLLGAGAVLALYFGGALPNRKTDKVAAAAPDQSAALAKLQQDVTAAQRETADARLAAEQSSAAVRKALADAGVANTDPAQAIATLAGDKRASDARATRLATESTAAQTELTRLRKAATDAEAAERIAKRNLLDSQTALTTAKKDATDAAKALAEARKELAAVKKAADDKVADVLAAAEAKEKDAAARLADSAAKLTEAAKRQTDLSRLADEAKKSAADAAKARDASEALVKAVGDRLAKARFVGDRPDAAALVKGLDDVIKAAATDTSSTLRDELVKARDQEAKLKAELASVRAKEAEASKAAIALKAEAQRLQDAARTAEQNLTTGTAKLREDNEKLKKAATEAVARAAEAEESALAKKAEAERLATDVTRLKADNDRLARDLETVRDLAEMLKASGSAVAGPLPRQEPTKLAERYFGDGLRSFFAGQFAEAESDFRKAIQFRADDARFHYLLGLALWMAKDAKGAEAEFEKGRDLELLGRPASRAVSAVLERIQGPARQAVNAYRP